MNDLIFFLITGMLILEGIIILYLWHRMGKLEIEIRDK